MRVGPESAVGLGEAAGTGGGEGGGVGVAVSMDAGAALTEGLRRSLGLEGGMGGSAEEMGR